MRISAFWRFNLCSCYRHHCIRNKCNIILASCLFFDYFYLWMLCHGSKSCSRILPVVSSCSAIWVDTKMLTLLCSRQPLAWPLVHPLALRFWSGKSPKCQSGAPLDLSCKYHRQQVTPIVPEIPSLSGTNFVEENFKLSKKACSSLQGIWDDYYHKVCPFHCHTNPHSNDSPFLSLSFQEKCHRPVIFSAAQDSLMGCKPGQYLGVHINL
jgi:hypothetical protein